MGSPGQPQVQTCGQVPTENVDDIPYVLSTASKILINVTPAEQHVV